MIPKEELAAMLHVRITNALKRILNDDTDPTATDKQTVLELAEWLLKSGHVTEQTMGLVAGNPSDSEHATQEELKEQLGV